MRALYLPVLVAGCIVFATGLWSMPTGAKELRNETKLAYKCVPTRRGKCRCDLVWSEASSPVVLGMTSKASCRIDERTGDLVMTLQNFCVFRPGSKISGTGIEFLPDACDESPGEENTPRLVAYTATVHESDTVTILETRAQANTCNPSKQCCKPERIVVHAESVQ